MVQSFGCSSVSVVPRSTCRHQEMAAPSELTGNTAAADLVFQSALVIDETPGSDSHNPSKLTQVKSVSLNAIHLRV